MLWALWRGRLNTRRLRAQVAEADAHRVAVRQKSSGNYEQDGNDHGARSQGTASAHGTFMLALSGIWVVDTDSGAQDPFGPNDSGVSLSAGSRCG
jgi:hypothetical protein